MEGDRGRIEGKCKWVNDKERCLGRWEKVGFQPNSEVILQIGKLWQNPLKGIDGWSRGKNTIVSSRCGASNIWRPASQTSDNAAGSLSRSLPVRGAVHMRSLRHYSYIMGCLNHWRCSTLINYLTAYIWLLTHLVNGLQQSMSDPIPQLERFTNYLAWDTCNIIT